MQRAERVIAPDFIEPIIAYRGFLIWGDELQKIFKLTSTTYINIEWYPQEIKRAVCLQDFRDCDCRYPRYPYWDVPEGDEPSRVPHEQGNCGIYSLKRSSTYHIEGQISRRMALGILIAEVEIWGKVVEHVDGYRSEYARIKRVLEVKAPGRYPNIVSHYFREVYDLKEEE